MSARTALVAGAAALGFIGGPAALAGFHQPSIGWQALLLAFAACAIGPPLCLALLAGSRRYKAMVLVWSGIGLVAVFFLAAGAAAAVRTGAHALLSLAIGTGLLTGLGLVKLAIRKGRARHGA